MIENTVNFTSLIERVKKIDDKVRSTINNLGIKFGFTDQALHKIALHMLAKFKKVKSNDEFGELISELDKNNKLSDESIEALKKIDSPEKLQEFIKLLEKVKDNEEKK